MAFASIELVISQALDPTSPCLEMRLRLCLPSSFSGHDVDARSCSAGKRGYTSVEACGSAMSKEEEVLWTWYAVNVTLIGEVGST